MAQIDKYGYRWPQAYDPLQIEMACIKRGIGHSKSFHFEQMRRILGPRLDAHRWNDLCRDEILRPNAKVTVLMGPGSTGKTHSAAWIYLCEYMVWPDETMVLVSSTDIRGLKLRVWGELTMLWQQAVEAYEYIPGHLLESRLAIATDELEDGEFATRKIRDMRKGIVGVPCVVGGKMVGLSKFHGIKQKRLRLIADEAAMMSQSFLDSFANLNNNEDFQAVIIGNPNDPMDPLGKAAEPMDGWTSHLEPNKTTVWDTKFFRGRCVNLIGTDSPNFDFPDDKPIRYRYLINREKIQAVVNSYGKDSFEYFSQCVGSMKVGVLARRVITRDLCRKFNAQDNVVWDGSSDHVKIAALDAAYGGDRCVLTKIEFGKDVNGKVIISVSPPMTVPISAKSDTLPEDQIAEWCKTYCEREGISPDNFFHDSTGRGTLGTHLARVWSAQCNPVEFGGNPTARPVSMDIFTYDSKTRLRRHKLCQEHYRKFVTELWFSVRYAIEAGQMRGLPDETMDEGCMREWSKTKDDKIELETKEKMKERTGRSPDLMDSLCIAVEGARRRGFVISKLSNDESEIRSSSWIGELDRQYRKDRNSHQLVEV